MTPSSAVDTFVAAVRGHDLTAVSAAVDWAATGRRRVREAADEIAGEVERGVLDEVVRRGLAEARDAAGDPALVARYLRTVADRLGNVRQTRLASHAEVERLLDNDPEATTAPVYVVEGDDALLVASPPQGDQVVILGWLDSPPD